MTIPLQGGLGNQLFQLAAGLTVGQRTGRAVAFSDHWLRHPSADETPRALSIGALLASGELIGTHARRIGGAFDRVHGRRVVERRSDDDALLRVRARTREIAGYFQRLDYVRESWPILRSRLAASADPRHQRLLDATADPAGALHYRLGDYAHDPAARAHHGVTDPTYFQAAMVELSREKGVREWRLVSDQPAQAARLLAGSTAPGTTLTQQPLPGDEWDDLVSLATASACVLSNSSFSWWAGFLGSELRGARVVAPTPWFAAESTPEPPLFPGAWRRLPRALLAAD